MTNIELQLQELLALGKNNQAAVSKISTDTSNIWDKVKLPPDGVDFTPVLDAIKNIQVTAPAVDFSPLLTAIASLDAKIGTMPEDAPAPTPVVDSAPVPTPDSVPDTAPSA